MRASCSFSIASRKILGCSTATGMFSAVISSLGLSVLGVSSQVGFSSVPVSVGDGLSLSLHWRIRINPSRSTPSGQF